MGRNRTLNTITKDLNYAYIHCKHGIIIIDLKDLDKIKNYTWFTKKSMNNSYYVYASTTIDKKEYKLSLHRFIINAQQGSVVDHINGNTLDNRKINLRLCSKNENNKNAKKNKRGTSSIYKGVTKRPSGRFGVYIQCNKKTYCVGTYDSELDAGIAYNKKAVELFGEYAKLNKIGE